jgi:hypothetical protein
VTRIKAGGDKGWAESSGKKYLGDATVPVGFSQPASDGDFQWQCRTGCLNIRVRIRDKDTKKVLPEARVQLTVKLAGESVTADAPSGVLCPALKDLAVGCGPTIQNVLLERKRDLDLYYWLPGVVKKTAATLYVSVRVPRYPTVNKSVALTLLPNVAFANTITLNRFLADDLLYNGVLLKGVAIGDFSSYCAKAIASLDAAAGTGITSEEQSAGLYIVGKAEEGLRALGKISVGPLTKLCGVLDLPKMAGRLNKAAAYRLWKSFRPPFGFPVHGLLGANRWSDRVLQQAFDFAGFYRAFNDGLVAYLYDRIDPSNPDPRKAGAPGPGSRLNLKIFEVSHRLPGGTVKDALYLTMTWKKGGEPPPVSYTAYAVDGYWPSCWLDPSVNNAEFTWFENSCKTNEP